MPTLFDAYPLGEGVTLPNRIVMAPMTRTRTSSGRVPNASMARYYAQRATAGLLITEATDVSPHSNGYSNTPGIYTPAQVEGWRLVTDEVHRRGGRIFQQIWHVGRMAHTSQLPDGETPWSATDEQALDSDVFAHGPDGRLRYTRASRPRAIRTGEIPGLIHEFAVAFKNAKSAGFDGVEIHAANGYLFEQFLNATLNTRTDGYGGRTLETRTRLLLEVIDAAVEEFGHGRVGVRLSPHGSYGSMPTDPHTEETLLYLCRELSRRGVAYLHFLYEYLPAANMETAEFRKAQTLSDDLVRKVREKFKGAVIWCGGFTEESARNALETGWVDLIAFGRPFIANPDLVARFENNWPLAEADRLAYYTRNGEKGYTDFPPYAEQTAQKLQTAWMG